MAKKIDGYIKLHVPAGQANPSPPIGPALGQRGVNIMAFCKAFNAHTQSQEQGMPIPTVITVYTDKSFTFVTKTAPTSFLLKKAAKLEKAASEAGRESVGDIAGSQQAPADLRAHGKLLFGVRVYYSVCVQFCSAPKGKTNLCDNDPVNLHSYRFTN